MTDLFAAHSVTGVSEPGVRTLDTPFTVRIETRSRPTQYRAWNLPDGLSLNEATGAIAGAIATPASHTFLIGAGDATGRMAYALADLDFRNAQSPGNALEAGREGEPLVGRASLGNAGFSFTPLFTKEGNRRPRSSISPMCL